VAEIAVDGAYRDSAFDVPEAEWVRTVMLSTRKWDERHFMNSPHCRMYAKDREAQPTG
jgi:hypothetical protein